MPEGPMESMVDVDATVGAVSTLLLLPPQPSHLLLLGHGAATTMRHPTMENIALALAKAGIATLRYNFPYAEHGRGRDSQEVCTATVRSVATAARQGHPDLPLLAGGHSFGGRMTSIAASESPLAGVAGLVFFSFPLHPARQPATTRAAHLQRLDLPMLFLSGTRDELAQLNLLRDMVAALGRRATLHLLDTADHGYRVQKRARTTPEPVFDEMARILRQWADRL